ncbi:MAG: ATP-binding cassette domain-containing protein [Saprospiraceae bacterium]|nr:ATP-binding cassette domain-containing protein [Saprospiraceae bacterium]
MSSASPIPLNKTNSLVESYLTARDEHFKILIRQYYLFIIFKILVAAGFLFMGGILVFNQQMNIGQFVASEIIVLLLIASSEKLLLSLESVYDLLTSIEKIGQVTDMQLEYEGGYTPERTASTKGLAVGMNDIFFRYKDATFDNISGLTFEIGANERICISGSNTSGKSTLLKLLTGLYSPDRGSITYDDLPIKNYNLAHLRQVISLCVSEDRIFEGSIMDNLSLGLDIDMVKVSSVCEKILLLDFIKTLPQGYNTMIGPQGKKLSRSIIQKISIARNILKNPRLFLIEDFFSDIEKYEKIKIFQYLQKQEHNWTLIVISKDSDIIQMMNKVVEMENGRIRAIINHKS